MKVLDFLLKCFTSLHYHVQYKWTVKKIRMFRIHYLFLHLPSLLMSFIEKNSHILFLFFADIVFGIVHIAGSFHLDLTCSHINAQNWRIYFIVLIRSVLSQFQQTLLLALCLTNTVRNNLCPLTLSVVDLFIYEIYHDIHQIQLGLLGSTSYSRGPLLRPPAQKNIE